MSGFRGQIRVGRMLDTHGVYKMLYSSSSLLGAAHPRFLEMRRALPVVSPESRVGSRVSGRISCLYLTYDPPELRDGRGEINLSTAVGVCRGLRLDGTRFAGRVRIFFGALDHCVGRSAVATTSDAPNGGSGL